MQDFLNNYNMLVLLGATATGKTHLGVQLADYFGGQIISADSRQVYCELTIGSGKDLSEYTLSDEKTTRTIPYHLIDIAELSQEYSVFNYQQDFYRTCTKLFSQKVLPIVVGGTGMYLDAVLRHYDLLDVPANPALREQLASKNNAELAVFLQNIKPNLHNHTDLTERHRLLRAIEIETYMQGGEAQLKHTQMPSRPPLKPFVLGITFPREQLRHRISFRLQERFKNGMIEEVESLHKSGITWERLERLGLEYRFIAQYLQGTIPSYNDLFKSLSTAIKQFAKRQETWFRGMEKKGIPIHWLSKTTSFFSEALDLLENAQI